MPGIKEAREALMEERQRTLASIDELNARLAEIDAALKPLESLMGNGRAPTRRQAPGRNGRTAAAPARRAAKTTGRPPREGTMAAAIVEYLGGQGRTASHADEILQHLQGIERAPSGKNPKASVEQTLRQLEQRGWVKNAGRNRWRRTGT
jgi:hypothetical protein